MAIFEYYTAIQPDAQSKELYFSKGCLSAKVAFYAGIPFAKALLCNRPLVTCQGGRNFEGEPSPREFCPQKRT
jgi:hypothetical protein